jgi:hypothetical protein
MFIGIMKIHIWSYLYKHVTNPEKKCFKENNFFYRSLKKRNVVYIIFFIKIKASYELTYSSSFFHCHLIGFLKDMPLHLCD